MRISRNEAQQTGIEMQHVTRLTERISSKLGQIDQSLPAPDLDPVGRHTNSSGTSSEIDEVIHFFLSDRRSPRDFFDPALLHVSEAVSRSDQIGIRHSLFFPSMGYRETDIPRRHARTFDWIFKEPRKYNNGRSMWSSFPEWLTGPGRDMYWITGKPGAGKSTLMKFIFQDPRFEELLQKWTNGDELIIARYFAWTAGADHLQKSQAGLFRALLFDILSRREDLIQRVFSARWCLNLLFPGTPLPTFSLTELKAAFTSLLSEIGDSAKIVLIIDGLDEFEEGHKELLSLLFDLNSRNNIKISISSRPWNVFKRLAQNPMLQLENLTKSDIQLFVRETFDTNPAYKVFSAINRDVAQTIARRIEEKARGVFLWVSVVTRLLSESLEDGYTAAELLEVLDSLPSEVSDLYQRLWHRMSPRSRAKAAPYFQLLHSCEEVNLVLFGLALHFGDDDVPIDKPTSEMTDEYLINSIAYLERRVSNYTAGMVEIVDNLGDPRNARVMYMHRTAKAWVDDNWESISSSTGEEFDPFFWLLKGEIRRVVAGGGGSNGGTSSRQAFIDVATRVKAQPERLKAVVDLLNLYSTYVRGIFLSHESWFDMDEPQHWAIRLGLDRCDDFPKFAAIVPIVPYIKGMAVHYPESPAMRSPQSRVLDGIIFGRYVADIQGKRPFIGSGDMESNLDLLEFLLQHGVLLDHAQRLRRLVKGHLQETTSSMDATMADYFSRVLDILPRHEPADPPASKRTRKGLRHQFKRWFL